MKEYNSISFLLDDGSEQEFAILENTIVNGISYLLVTEAVDDDTEESDAYILKATGESDEDGMIAYEFVEDDDELQAVFAIFEQLLDDEEISVSF